MADEGILSKLVEKKNIITWIKLRRRMLEKNIEKIPETTPPEKREFGMQKTRGRLEELNNILRVAHGKKFKEESIQMWRELENKKD